MSCQRVYRSKPRSLARPEPKWVWPWVSTASERIGVTRCRTTPSSAAPTWRRSSGTKNITAIAPTTDAHQHAAAPIGIQPVTLLPLLHPTPPQHWTAPGCAGLNDVRKIAPTGIAPLEALGF